MNIIHEKLLAIIIIALTLLLILGIIFTYLDMTIIEGYMSPTNYTNNYEIIQQYQNFNLVDSVVDFFTPEIFRSSSYQKNYTKPSNSKSNNYNDSNMVLENTAIKIRNYTTTSSPNDKGYPICEEKTYTPTTAIRPEWNYKSVYAMCGDVPVGKWGIGDEGVDRAIVNCNGERRSQYRWGKCAENLSGLDRDTVAELQKIRIEFQKITNGLSISLPKVSNFTTNKIPLNVLTYQLYGSLDKKEALNNLNNFRDTSEVSGIIKILSNG